MSIPKTSIVPDIHPRLPMTRAARVALLPMFFGLAAIFIAIARYRLVDGDEGFYLLAAKSVFHGKLLYRDFFYTQMPLLPYIYGLWLKIAGETWNSGRLLSSLLASLLGCLLYVHVTRVTRSWVAGCCALLLFVSSTGILVWFPLVKTPALSILLLFGAYLALWEVSDRRSLVVGGLLLGLSIDTRLYLAGVLPVFLLCIYCRRSVLPGLAASYAWFFGGLAAGLAPNLVWLLSAPGNYFFNNLGYHALRSDAGLIGLYRQKIGFLLRAVGLFHSPEGNGLPFGLLVLLNALGIVLYRKLPGPRVWPATYIAAMLIFVSTLPTPPFSQYYAVALPFLIVGAVAFAWEGTFTKVRIAAVTILLLAYLSPMPAELSRYVSSGVGVIGIDTAEYAIDFRLDSIRQVSREIDGLMIPGEPVLSLWPGYLFESRAECLSGMENHSGLWVAPKLSPAALEKYRILSQSDIEAGLARHYPCLAVVGNEQTMHVVGAVYREMLERYGYREAYRLGHASIYTCKP